MADEQVQSGFPQVREVALGAPFRWLSRGLEDLKSCPGPSLFYGLCFALMGYLLNAVVRHAYHYVSALASGFLLLGPLLAIGLYELSRRRESGQPCALVPTLAIWRRNAGNLAIYSLVLIVIFLVWARASLVIFALFYTGEPTLKGFMAQIGSLENIEFLAVYFGVGFFFAALVFAGSVVSVPLMLDRHQDSITAMLTSIAALAKNPHVMLLWAALIAALTALGLATFYLGLVITVPLIGHATWHAYREIVA